MPNPALLRPLSILILAALTWTASANAQEERPPNIVIIFIDDQGYGDVGSYGAEGFKTPQLDRMAREGLRFTSFYSASSVCSPSRAALLTGCYPLRVGVPGVYFPSVRRGLNPEETTIAELLKAKGYATACIGKWHLGNETPFLPTMQGFDSYWGIPYSNDMRPEHVGHMANGRFMPPLPILQDTDVIELDPDQAYITARYTTKSIEFIRENRDKPFFLYLAHTMPHVPLYVSGFFSGQSERGLYGDVIMEIDWSVGRVLSELRTLGLAENTFVFFTTDNGPWLSKGAAGGSGGPLRDGKFSTYEGGFRVPGIAWWPGKIPARTETDAVAGTIDLLPTIVNFTGAKMPEAKIDGKDLSTLLTDPENNESPHEAYFYHRRDELQAVRMGDWKFRRAPAQRGRMTEELFNLSEDIGEQRNLIEEQPEIADRLRQRLDEFSDELKREARPGGRI